MESGNHHDRLILTCKKCSFVGDASNFKKSYKYSPPKPTSTCKDCEREQNRVYRVSNQPHYNRKARDRRHSMKKWAVEYKGSKCNHCLQEFHPAAFDFHHVDSTEKDSDPGLLMGRTKENLKEELDKCILLCANCHRIHHFKEGY